MQILCIDTCGLYYSIAVIKNKEVIGEVVCNGKHRQCEELVLQIEKMLKDLSLSYDAMDGICVTKGPGTFNGIRIGTSAAYGISLAKDIKLYGIGTVEMLAWKAMMQGLESPIIVYFSADNMIGFIQEFYFEEGRIKSKAASPQQTTREELQSREDYTRIVKFGVEIDLPGSNVSNAAAAGFVLISKLEDHQEIPYPTLFYGKPPGIHQKDPTTNSNKSS